MQIPGSRPCEKIIERCKVSMAILLKDNLKQLWGDSVFRSFFCASPVAKLENDAFNADIVNCNGVTVRDTLPRILGLRELALKIKDDSYSVDPEENDSNTSEYVIKHFKGNDFRNDLPADIVFHKVDIPGKHVVYIYSYPLILVSEVFML